MRVLIAAAYGSKGDVLPFYGIALEMRRRGHEGTKRKKPPATATASPRRGRAD